MQTEKDRLVTVDGNEAAAHVAYRTSEVIAIYPITPSSTMGELADDWAAKDVPNIWGDVPVVQQMQSEAGAAGAVHGSLQAGALTTTFTASQGLLLMIPNMFKIAGELTPVVFHIAARAIATNALSIFGDHSDVMCARSTGWSMLFANNVQECQDMALIAHAATLKSRVPFLHIFDGFRTSHEVSKIHLLSNAAITSMIDQDLVRRHRERALNPEHPVIRGTAQNPDVFFQSREASNSYYDAVPGIVQDCMDQFAALSGRQYKLVEYVGAPDAERVIVVMGSAAETVQETLNAMNAQGEKVGLLKLRLFRPFPSREIVKALPSSVKAIAVLDRTKEPGASGEPLYKDVITALAEASHKLPMPRVTGGRFGLSSKEFTPAMVKAVYDELKKEDPTNGFTVGIFDDVTHKSLSYDPSFQSELEDCTKAIFWGLGSDGTVGANKSSIKLIGETTSSYAQGYFVYDSKKSGSVTISHLRFGPRPIQSAYLVQSADFVAVHQFSLLARFPVFENAAQGATVLINAPFPAERVWAQLPRALQEVILKKDLQLYSIDANKVARDAGLGGRINTVMQVAFFALTNVIPVEDAISGIKSSIVKLYSKRGTNVVDANFAAVDQALSHLAKVDVPKEVNGRADLVGHDCALGSEFVRDVIGEIISGRGENLPVSKLPVDGTFPVGTARFEKRRIADEAPVWDPNLCIQCGKCVLVCPHAVIRAKIADQDKITGAPDGFLSTPAKWREAKEKLYTIQISHEDCTGCGLCIDVCPAHDKKDPNKLALTMAEAVDLETRSRKHWDYFLELPDEPVFDEPVRFGTIKNTQLLPPLFEFSGACSGCGETPYIKLVSQLFGDHALVANATGCSSIYGGNLPTTPWTCNQEGRGPAWANSLFEDNAEFGFGMRVALDAKHARAVGLIEKLGDRLPVLLTDAVLKPAKEHGEIVQKRHEIARLRAMLLENGEHDALELAEIAEGLLETSVWIIGGDGWAYDIGFGGLDHVLACGRNINVLVLDTEVYSNTGGQASKSTSRGATARFAAAGKSLPKKDLGMMMMTYGNVYVAQVAVGASDAQLMKAIVEAESYDGPSLVIAYGHCISHGLDMGRGFHHQKLAVDSGYWPLYRFDPRRKEQGLNPFQLDSKNPSIPVKDFLASETRYTHLMRDNSADVRALLELAEADVKDRWTKYSALAANEV